MIDKINGNQVRDILDAVIAQPTDPPKTRTDDPVDASLQADYAALIDSAMGPAEDDAAAVSRALELIQAGQLETPQNILAAAQNILEYGI